MLSILQAILLWEVVNIGVPVLMIQNSTQAHTYLHTQRKYIYCRQREWPREIKELSYLIFISWNHCIIYQIFGNALTRGFYVSFVLFGFFPWNAFPSLPSHPPQLFLSGISFVNSHAPDLSFGLNSSAVLVR